MRILNPDSSWSGAEVTDDEVVVAVTRDELAFLANTINETREAVADWEFSTRLGVSVDEAEALRVQIVDLRRGSAAPE